MSDGIAIQYLFLPGRCAGERRENTIFCQLLSQQNNDDSHELFSVTAGNEVPSELVRPPPRRKHSSK